MSEPILQARLKALFLDDDADILTAAQLVLSRHGLDLTKAETPHVARDLIDSETFDVVLLDLNFRRGDTSGEAGLTFLRALMATHPHMPVVVVTGHSGMNIAIEAMRLGAQDFVVKPWNNDRFVSAIRAAIEQPRVAPPPQAPKDLNLERSERDLIKAALDRHQFNISHAARDLGLTRAALYRRMEKHGL